ncbi:selenium cofactor biosynthesis protein YqeC [Natrialbaceae archaeon A-CW2]
MADSSDTSRSNGLVHTLEADTGVVCVVGAGGKKSTLYELAGRLERCVLTATVRIPIFDEQVAKVDVVSDPVGTLEQVIQREDSGSEEFWPLGVVPERDGTDRYRGYDPETVDRIAALDGIDQVLVKADGARTRLLKAPNDREPQLPRSADTVLAIASCHAVGRSLEADVVHRPERVAALTGRSVGDVLEPADIATVLTHSDGGMKGIPPSATPIPVINMVDDEADLEVAREIGRLVLDDGGDDRIEKVVLTSMIEQDPLVDVLE